MRCKVSLSFPLLSALLLLAATSTARANDDFQVEFDRPFYISPERITATITNGTSIDLDVDFEFSTPEGDYRDESPDGILKAGASMKWTLPDDFTHPGSYNVRVTGYSVPDLNEMAMVETSFDIIPPAGAVLIVRMTQSRYHHVDDVRFFALNRTNRSRSLPDREPWSILTAAGKRVFKPVASQPDRLEARDGRRLWSWNQEDSADQQVPNGRYTARIVLGTRQNPDPRYRSFRIVD